MAFYLQYTIKVVSVLFLMTILTSLNCRSLPAVSGNCKEIKNYLDLELRFSADTIRYG